MDDHPSRRRRNHTQVGNVIPGPWAEWQPEPLADTEKLPILYVKWKSFHVQRLVRRVARIAQRFFWE